MSEEEIIESTKYHILLEYQGFCNIDKVSLQGLLDLYNKEKSRIMELAKLLDRQESEIKSLEQELEIEKGCSIRKDKIRELLAKYKLEYDEQWCNSEHYYKFAKDVKELLEKTD